MNRTAEMITMTMIVMTMMIIINLVLCQQWDTARPACCDRNNHRERLEPEAEPEARAVARAGAGAGGTFRDLGSSRSYRHRHL